MSNKHDWTQALEALERQHTLDRERLVVQNLHDNGICLKHEGCIICREEAQKPEPAPKLAPTLTESDHEYAHERGICVDSCPHCAQARSQNASNNVGAQGCMATSPSIFDGRPIPLGSWVLTDTLRDRGEEYGDYTNMAQVAQCIKESLRLSANYDALPYTHRESLDLIATKIARIVCGNPNNPDSWLDIEGYAKLARDRISIATAAGGGPATS